VCLNLNKKCCFGFVRSALRTLRVRGGGHKGVFLTRSLPKTIALWLGGLRPPSDGDTQKINASENLKQAPHRRRWNVSIVNRGGGGTSDLLRETSISQTTEMACYLRGCRSGFRNPGGKNAHRVHTTLIHESFVPQGTN